MAIKVYEAHVENYQAVPVPMGKTWKILAVVMEFDMTSTPINTGDHLHAVLVIHPAAFGNGAGLDLLHEILNWTAPESLHVSSKIVASIGGKNVTSREHNSLGQGWYIFNSSLPDIAIGNPGVVRLSLRVNGSLGYPLVNSGFLIEETGG